MIGFLVLSFPPLLHIFGLYESLVFYIWPTMASFIIFENVFTSVGYETWEIAYGLMYQIVWIGVLYYYAKKSFFEYIIVLFHIFSEYTVTACISTHTSKR